MSYFNQQNPPMPGPAGYPPPGYPGAQPGYPPPQTVAPPPPTVIYNQAAPAAAPSQPQGSMETGLLAGCLAAMGCCCCLEMCC